jgi:hypothetical protein
MDPMKVPPEGSGDKADGPSADSSGMRDTSAEERAAAARRRLAAGYYTSSEVLDRLATRLLEVLRREA